MARTFPPSFIEKGPKLRVLVIMKWEWPETAKKKGMSPEEWPIARKRNFFSGLSEWESCSPGYTGDMPCWQKPQLPYKKLTFRPSNSTFLSLAANWSHTGQRFQHRKGVSSVPWYGDIKSVTPSPQQVDFWPKNGQIWPKNDSFGQIWAFLVHLIQCPTKKQFEQVPRWFFQYVGTKTFTYFHKN